MKLPTNLLQTKWLSFIGGAVLLGLAVFQFLSVPSKRQQVTVAENDFAVARRESEKLSEILTEVKMVEGNLEVIQQALPVEDAVPSLITQLEKIAQQSGVGVQHLGFGEGEGEVNTISLTAVVDGSYGALQTFFRNLENTSRVINVTNFRFSPAQKEEEGATLSITLGLEAFYLASAGGFSASAPLTLNTASKEYIDLIRKVKALRVYKSEIAD